MKIASGNYSRAGSPVKTPWQDVFRTRPGIAGKTGISGALEQPARYLANRAYSDYIRPKAKQLWNRYRLEGYRQYINYWNYPHQYVPKNAKKKLSPQEKGGSALYMQPRKLRGSKYFDKSKLCKCGSVQPYWARRVCSKRCAKQQTTRMYYRKSNRKNNFRYRSKNYYYKWYS